MLDGAAAIYDVTAQTGCVPVSLTGTNIIFIEKRKPYPASLENAIAFSDLSVGLTMLFA